MKTKNIFRMLLMAVVLLMGANNAQAVDVWTGAGTGNVTIEGSAFDVISDEDLLRVYTTDGSQLFIGLGSDTSSPLFYTPYNSWIRNGEYYNSAGYFEFPLTLEIIASLKSSGLHLENYSKSITQVSLVSSGTPVGPTTYTVTYIVDGSTYTTQEYEAGSTITLPEDPTKEGYDFTGWSGLPEDNVINGNITATANFIKVYAITLDYDQSKGTATLSKDKASGYYEEIQLTIVPADGYEVESVTAPNAANGGNVWQEGGIWKFGVAGSDVTVTITFKQTETPAATTYTVSIANGIQNGSVSANPTNAEEGATVTLTVTAYDGYQLESLTVTDANGQAVTVNGNQFTMPASNVTVSATFAQVQSAEYTISTNVTGEGSITIYDPHTATAKEGDVVSFGAQPNQYYYELGEVTVVDAEGNQITVTDNKFTMPASNVTINATFVAKKYTLTWQIEGDENPHLVQQITYGETIVNPEVPEREGYVFNGWGQHSETMPAYDLTIKGSFSQIYKVTLVYDESQGTVTIDKSQSLGNEELHLTITPAEGLQVASVTATDANGNVNMWGENNTIFRIGYSDVTVTVTFKEADAVVYNVTNNNNAQNGRVWADVNQAVAGQTVTLYNQPNEGYELDYYVVTAGEDQIEVTNGQFTMPESDVTISGEFKQGTFTITYYVDGQVVATQSYTYGDAIVLPEEPTKEGYTFNGWQGLNYQTMPGQNLQVYATFTQNGGGGGGQDIEDDTQYVNVTVGSTGYTTFCSDKALDVTGLSVYYAESINTENVTLKKLTGVVAAGTGLLVKGSCSIPVSNGSGTSYNNNLLVGVLSETEAPEGAYVLVNRNGTATFAQTSAESKATVPAGKSYLVAPSGARYLNIVFDDNATGISTLKTQLTGEETIYNLRGQRVSNPTKGLYIVNGKKVFIK